MNNTPDISETAEFIIRVHMSDGTTQSFLPTNTPETQAFWQQFDPGRIFAHPRLLVAGEYAKSIFVTSHVVRVDFVNRDFSSWVFPGGYADVVELTEDEFRAHAHLDDPAKMQRREECTPVGDLLVSFLELRMAGGARYRMMTEFPVKLPVENQARMRFLLSGGTFHLRLACGGFGVINLANLVSYTVYPGVPDVPADAWLGEPIPDGGKET